MAQAVHRHLDRAFAQTGRVRDLSVGERRALARQTRFERGELDRFSLGLLLGFEPAQHFVQERDGPATLERLLRRARIRRLAAIARLGRCPDCSGSVGTPPPRFWARALSHSLAKKRSSATSKKVRKRPHARSARASHWRSSSRAKNSWVRS